MSVPTVWISTYPYTRNEALEYFSGSNFQAKRISNLSEILYPQFTRTVVGEIASAKAIGFDLALLAFLPSIAAADRGKHRVKISQKKPNSLSCIFLVGAESGAGKGRALEESLSFFSHWEKTMVQKVRDENKQRSHENDLTNIRIKALERQYIKSLDPEIAELILKERNNLKELLPDPYLLANDFSSAAYIQALIKNGFVIRLESDGIMLPNDTMQIVNKAWAGEISRRTRISMPDGVVYDPFIVDLVMTQPEFFFNHINNRKFIESGRLARTLSYLYNVNNFTPYQPSHEIDQQILGMFHNKLEDLLHYSEISSDKMYIFVDQEAESLFFNRERIWRDQCKPGGSLYKIKDFGGRMGQYAIRLAGILHLAENEVGSQTKINAETMQTAIDMMEIFADHTFAYRIKDYGEFNLQCCCDIMFYVLDRNLYDFPESELKDALGRYSASEINTALYYLQRDRHLKQDEHIQRERRVGRKPGRIFINPYYERYGQRI